MLCFRDLGDLFLNDKPASYNFKFQNSKPRSQSGGNAIAITAQNYLHNHPAGELLV